MADYVPRADAVFDEWVAQFTGFVGTHGASLGIPAARITDLVNATGAWRTAYQGHFHAQLEARSAKAVKDKGRADVESQARRIARMLQASLTITNALRAEAGITAPDLKPTPLSASHVEETAPPLLLLDWSQRKRVTVHFGHNPSNEHANALPAGMRGAKLWCAVGGIPRDEDGWRFLDDCTRSPYVHVLANSAPVTMAYRAQYFDRKMRRGAFSEPAVVTVTA